MAIAIEEADIVFDRIAKDDGVFVGEERHERWIESVEFRGVLKTNRRIGKIDAVFPDPQNVGVEWGIRIHDQVLFLKDLKIRVGDRIAKGADFPLVVIAIGAFAIKEKIFHLFIMAQGSWRKGVTLLNFFPKVSKLWGL